MFIYYNIKLNKIQEGKKINMKMDLLNIVNGVMCNNVCYLKLK